MLMPRDNYKVNLHVYDGMVLHALSHLTCGLLRGHPLWRRRQERRKRNLGKSEQAFMIDELLVMKIAFEPIAHQIRFSATLLH